jgi:tripartite-type tricarboxylate transporter receptor subunit TctC
LDAANVIADPYPDRPVKLIVAQAAGGRDDMMARALGESLGEVLGRSVVIINYGGAGGTIGAEAASKATPDGYTLFLGGSNTLAIAPAINPALPYNPGTDFVAIGGLARVPYALAVNAHVPVHSARELVTYARARPGKLNYGSSGNGSTSALAAELLKTETGIDIVGIPYRGLAPAMAELLSGRIDIMFADLADLMPHASAGAVRMVAVVGGARSHMAPALPTMAEEGIKGLVIEPWAGIFVPNGTPQEVIATLSDALIRTRRDPEFRRHLEALGFDSMDETAQALTALMQSDIRKYSALIERAGIKPAP